MEMGSRMIVANEPLMVLTTPIAPSIRAIKSPVLVRLKNPIGKWITCSNNLSRKSLATRMATQHSM